MFLSALAGLFTQSWATAADTNEISGKLLVVAAASTTDAIERIRADFVRLHPAVTIRTSYGASSTLAQQVNAGAGADVFLSASTEWADFLSGKKLIERRRDLLGNQLVIVVPADSQLAVKGPGDLAQPKIRRLVLADPKSVPAGIYAKQALGNLNLWTQLEAKVAGAADVRQALHFVETGAAEAGIVYATDAAASTAVRIAARIDPKLSEPIHYPLALLKHGADNPAAIAFYDYLGSPAAGAVFRRHSFVVLDALDNDKPRAP
jgi:molybdate transport system substrate-binding protein